MILCKVFLKSCITVIYTRTLNDSEKELFEKYCEAQSEIEGIVNYDTFTYSLRFGIMLMIEILQTD